MSISKLHYDQIKELVDELVEEKLLRMLKDPDWGLEIKPEIKMRIKKSLKAELAGEKGISLNSLKQQL